MALAALRPGQGGGFSISMVGLYQLASFELSIPVWQMLVYTVLISLFMFCHRPAFALTTTYVFALYWIFYLFGPHFISMAGDSPSAITVYILFGLGLGGLSLFAFFFYEE